MANLKHVSRFIIFGQTRGIKWTVSSDFLAKKKQLSFYEGLRPIAASITEDLLLLRSTIVLVCKTSDHKNIWSFINTLYKHCALIFLSCCFRSSSTCRAIIGERKRNICSCYGLYCTRVDIILYYKNIFFKITY